MGFENVGRFDIAMYDTHFEKVLDGFNNFGYDAYCLFFAEFTVPG